MVLGDPHYKTTKMQNKNIYYSDKYYNVKFEYRHVMLPKDLAKLVPIATLMTTRTTKTCQSWSEKKSERKKQSTGTKGTTWTTRETS